MSAVEFLAMLTQLIFVAIFAVTLLRALRHATPADAESIVVRDRGIGVPVADLDHISDRFHRAVNVDDRSFAGMGLGLYICRGIIEQHGGTITVASTEGEGSIFTVTLPLDAAPA